MATVGSAAEQGELWSERSLDWADVQEGMLRPLYQLVLDRTGVGAETTLLDLGCGAGMVLSLAAAAGAETSGLDAAPGMLAIARDRVPQADLAPGELEDLPYGNAMFDIVTAIDSLQYANDPASAAREAVRVARETAPVVVAGWADPQDADAAAVFAALAPLAPPAPPGGPGPFALAEPAAVDGLLRSAGREPSMTEEVVCPWEYSDLDDAVRGVMSLEAAVRAVRHSGAPAVHEAVIAALTPFVDGRGACRLENTYRVVVGTAG